MANEVTIVLPQHAVRYLIGMCDREREELVGMQSTVQYSLALDAAFDSLNAIECAIPNSNAEEVKS